MVVIFLLSYYTIFIYKMQVFCAPCRRFYRFLPCVSLPPGGGRRVLAKLAKSANLWERRIAMVATLEHIRQGCLENTFWLAGRLLADPEDLMHKAAGWMLREAGKRDRAALEAFLAAHAARMPRTMLRYAIERLPVERRRAWLQTPRMPRNVQTSLQCRAGRV